ncbi:hypothetical protein SDC9_97925 [bioreactor metagenome]|uniref:Uncharacterized protein n=1 Tax=bioreactor metagenome TaxID=1076179 RepID=A0A645AEP0_9ZZZZ
MRSPNRRAPSHHAAPLQPHPHQWAVLGIDTFAMGGMLGVWLQVRESRWPIRSSERGELAHLEGGPDLQHAIDQRANADPDRAHQHARHRGHHQQHA